MASNRDKQYFMVVKSVAVSQRGGVDGIDGLRIVQCSFSTAHHVVYSANRGCYALWCGAIGSYGDCIGVELNDDCSVVGGGSRWAIEVVRYNSSATLRRKERHECHDE